jgi:hypothetical protein
VFLSLFCPIGEAHRWCFFFGALLNEPILGGAQEFLNLQPGSDFYKKFAVDCSRQQIGVDMFVCGGQYADVATLCMSRAANQTAPEPLTCRAHRLFVRNKLANNHTHIHTHSVRVQVQLGDVLPLPGL